MIETAIVFFIELLIYFIGIGFFAVMCLAAAFNTDPSIYVLYYL